MPAFASQELRSGDPLASIVDLSIIALPHLFLGYGKKSIGGSVPKLSKQRAGRRGQSELTPATSLRF